MNDYMLLMHNDAPHTEGTDQNWETYLTGLRKSGCFSGGSEIGEGVCISKAGSSTKITAHLGGYILVQAESLSEAKRFVSGNPVFEAGGTVEVRELPRSS